MPFKSSVSDAFVNQELIYTDITNATVAALLAMQTAGTLKPKQKYLITNSFHGGQILVEAISGSQLSNIATWLRNTNLCAFGIIGITAGAAGSVDTITVDGVNIMTSSVPYLTSLAVTATNVATNINANSVSSGYRAVAITNGYIVIASTTSGVAKNGLVISGTATTLTLGNARPLANGVNSTVQQLSIVYNIATDRISQCSDAANNIIKLPTGYTGDPLQEFPWGDGRYFNNTLETDGFINNFLYDSNGGFRNNICEGQSYFRDNFWAAGNTSIRFQVFFNTVKNNSHISNNVWNFTGSMAVGLIYYNTLYNISRISGNCVTGAGIPPGVFYNNLFGANSNIRDNLMIAGAQVVSISDNNLIGKSANISANTLLSGSQTTGILRNNLGFTAKIGNNTISSAAIIDNYLNGQNSAIQNNTVNGSGSRITGVYLNGNAAKIEQINFNSIANSSVRDITIEDSNATIGGITLSVDFPSLRKIQWGIDEYNFSYTSPVLNGAANNGLSGSAITLGYVPAKYYSYSADLECTAITSGAGATLKAGIDTDNDSSLLPATAITTLANTLTTLAPVKTKATALRKITATPGVSNITAGNFKIIIKGRIGI